MVARKKKQKLGEVDLNQARLDEQENARPKVAPTQKINTPKEKKEPKETSAEKQMPTINEKNKKIKPIGNVNKFEGVKKKPLLNRDENGKLLLTRRNVIYGAIGAGGVVAVGAGVKFATDTVSNVINSVRTLNVPKKNVVISDDLADAGAPFLNVAREIQLPYGTLAFANSSSVITCLIPTDSAKPLATVDIVAMSTGNQTTVLGGAVSSKEGYEIYDARANDNGIIWTEVNILQGDWRIYASGFTGGYNVSPTLLDQGGSDWETPTIAVSGNYAYWQVLPVATGSKNKMLSALKKADFYHLSTTDKLTSAVESNDDISNNPYTAYTSMGRMSTPVYGYKDGVIITPRANSGNIYYQMTYLDKDDKVKDSICLPQNMKPLEAGYGETGFSFCFDAIYNYGEGISNLGTYTPLAKTNDEYKDLKWLNFSRNPSAAPAWCKNYFIVRSSLAVCAVDLGNQSYCVLDRPNASDDYGDYLASTGECENIVTYANIFDQPVTGEERKYCSLRIWA